MSDIDSYLTRNEYATEIGINPQTLKKREEAAEGTEFALPEPIKKGAMKLYHRDAWARMYASRLEPFIEEAVRMGLVVGIGKYNADILASGSDAYDRGFKDGVESVAAELPDVPDSEGGDYYNNTTGPGYENLTRGGFQPLSSF